MLLTSRSHSFLSAIRLRHSQCYAIIHGTNSQTRCNHCVFINFEAKVIRGLERSIFLGAALMLHQCIDSSPPPPPNFGQPIPPNPPPPTPMFSTFLENPGDVLARTYKLKIMYTSVRTRQFLTTPFSRNIQHQNSSCFK